MSAAAATPTPDPPDSVHRPKHPLHSLTTYELRDYRRDLERAIAFFDQQAPVPPARHQLQSELDGVIAEQGDRARLAAHA